MRSYASSTAWIGVRQQRSSQRRQRPISGLSPHLLIKESWKLAGRPTSKEPAHGQGLGLKGTRGHEQCGNVRKQVIEALARAQGLGTQQWP